MATCVGSWLGGKWTTAGGSVFQAGIELYVTAEYANYCTYYWRTFVYVSKGDFEGSKGYCETSCNGKYSMTLYKAPSWPAIKDSSTFNANRGTTITCRNYTWYQRTSGRAESTANASYKVPSRTAHGKPTFTASSYQVGDGEGVTLTISPSGTQGNAQFAYFQISDGMGNYFYQSPTSLNNPKAVSTVDVPSAVLEKYGAEEYLAGATGALGTFNPMRLNCVYYAAREVHEWYGTYPASDWVWIEVEVVFLDMTLYDSQGAPHKVVKITVYDEDGNALSGTATAYDKDGNQL